MDDLPDPTPLPDIIVIGAMKCGTTALHRYLDRHPDIAMAAAKELNFFFGPDVQASPWTAGNWHRGIAWYARQFDAAARVRGESSPGYTSPDNPEVAARMRQVVPQARLVMLVRDPIERALSQYAHHRRDGDERREVADALLDPASQYVSRGRYHERLEPFLARFPPERITVIAQEELLIRRRATLRALYAALEVDDGFWADDLGRRWHAAAEPPPALPSGVRASLAERLADDAERLRALAGREFPGWTV